MARGTNDSIAAVFTYESVFTVAECARIRGLARGVPPADVGIYPPPDVVARRATTRMLPAIDWVEDRLLALARRANDHLDVELDSTLEAVMYVTYGFGDFFDWHTDLADGPESRRKVSISVMLSDPREYEGGELEIVGHGRPLPRGEVGSATVFPAHLAHRVTALRAGARHALVAWAHGPAFR